MVLPPMPSLRMLLCASFLDRPSASRANRTASRSSQRSWASSVEHVPSVIESPNATIAPVEDEEETSIAFNQYVEVVVPVNGFAVSSAAKSPEPFPVRYDVTCAPPCWLGCTPASGTCKLTARSCWARTVIGTGSLVTLPPAGTVTPADLLKNTCRFEP